MIFLMILCAVLALILGGSFYAYRVAFLSPKQDRERIPVLQGSQYDRYRPDMRRLFQSLGARSCEFVTVRSRDGLLLSARYYHVQDGAPLDIAFHGYRSSALTDFCGGADLSLKLGHNLLLVDQRSHGKSQGNSIAFGVQERWDALTWVQYALDRFGQETNILLYGISMGGATVLMASALDLPENVKAIIADCPYSSPKEIILKVGKEQGFPPALVWPFLRLGGKLYGGFDICEASPVEAVKHSRVPILLIHGEKDGFVPCSMSRDICHANPSMIRLHSFPNADHGMSYLEDIDRYESVVKEFVDHALAN